MYKCRVCLRFLPFVTTASLPSAAADASTWASLDPFVCFSICLEAEDSCTLVMMPGAHKITSKETACRLLLASHVSAVL